MVAFISAPLRRIKRWLNFNVIFHNDIFRAVSQGRKICFCDCKSKCIQSLFQHCVADGDYVVLLLHDSCNHRYSSTLKNVGYSSIRIFTNTELNTGLCHIHKHTYSVTRSKVSCFNLISTCFNVIVTNLYNKLSTLEKISTFPLCYFT